MWDAEEVWRNNLRNVRLSDLVDTLTQESRADIRGKTDEWVLAHAG